MVVCYTVVEIKMVTVDIAIVSTRRVASHVAAGSEAVMYEACETQT